MTWSKAEIRQARKIPLAPLLRQQGFQLREFPGQNFRLDAYGDLTIRDCYWIWKSRQLQGNTIDFFVMIQNLSFAQAMQKIFGASPSQNPANPPDLPAGRQEMISNLPS